MSVFPHLQNFGESGGALGDRPNDSKEVRGRRIGRDLTAISRQAARERWASARESADVIVRIYRRDAHVVPVPCPERPVTTLPPLWQGYGPISRATLARMVHIIGDGEPIWASLLTVTYHRRWPTCGPCLKRHLNALRTAICDRYGAIVYFWFLEYQERGAPHLHILLSFCPIGRYKRLSRGRRSWREPHEWVSAKWQACIGEEYATPEGLRAGCRWEAMEEPESAAGYMAAYSKKLSQKQIPPGYLPPGAWWGRSQSLRDPEPLHEMRLPRAMWREVMGAGVTSSRGTDYRVLHDGRRLLLAAADRLCGPALTPGSVGPAGDAGMLADGPGGILAPPVGMAGGEHAVQGVDEDGGDGGPDAEDDGDAAHGER